jgi:hypothetical protein
MRLTLDDADARSVEFKFTDTGVCAGPNEQKRMDIGKMI